MLQFTIIYEKSVRSTKYKRHNKVRIRDVYVRSIVFSTSQGTMGATGSSIFTDSSTSIFAETKIRK